MSKATINWIYNLNRERAEKVKPLRAELAVAISDDSLPQEFRQRHERELRARIDSTNAAFEKRIREAANEAMEEPRRKWAEGSGLKAEELAEVPLVVEQYKNKTAMEKRQLVAEIAADLDAGATSRALVKARAALTLSVPLGPVEARLTAADPVKKDARDAVEAIGFLAELAIMEPLREKAAAGLATASERIKLRSVAHDRGLREDRSFVDQVAPGYTGPTVERDGYPNAPFPEPHDPERDRQRKRAEQLRDGAAADLWLEQHPRQAVADGTREARLDQSHQYPERQREGVDWSAPAEEERSRNFTENLRAKINARIGRRRGGAPEEGRQESGLR